MTSSAESVPAFGAADLSNCEREQIHLAGSIQPHGALLVVEGPGSLVTQASLNAPHYLGLSRPVLGLRLDQIEGNLMARIASLMDDPLLQVQPTVVRSQMGPARVAFDTMLSRAPGGSLVIEFERAGPAIDHAGFMDRALHRILAALSLRALCDDTARLVRELTGYDRVMVYRFDKDGHGEVLAEDRCPALESFLGNWYPASDIPQIARRLYERNRIRVLVDVGYESVPVMPRASPVSLQELDMSLCVLRSVSPMHLEYLRNMGVAGTLVASLMVGGRLWGLIACHHYTPRLVQFETRAACEMLAEACATRIAALESFARSQAELSVRRLEQRMIEAISADGNWRNALFNGGPSLLQPLRATGAALLFDGQIMTTGEVPGSRQLREIADWLDGREGGPLIATASLGIDEPRFLPLVATASGLAAVKLSGSPGEYLVWFRPERVRMVTWGGDPYKAASFGAMPDKLSPRRSFAQWNQLVERTSESWGEVDFVAARLIGETVKDVIVQSRSVGLLVAQDRVDQSRQQLRQAELPVMIAEPAGRILLMNDALRRLFGTDTLQWLDDLPPLFEERGAVARRVQDLLERHVPWRGEVILRARDSGADARPLQVRADPITAETGRLLGFVILVTDLTAQKAAEVARQRLQARIRERSRPLSEHHESADLLFETLLATVLQNAQLAAMEIADSIDAERTPEMLDSVRGSINRVVRVLEQLLRAGRPGS